MDLSAIWAKAQGERELPEPKLGYNWFSADQMRAAMTPDPAALQRFAEAVAEECCAAVAKVGPSEAPLSLVTRGFVDAIRRHVKGE